MESQEIILAIKKSKKYKTLSEEIINDKIKEYALKNPNYESYPEKIILKEIKTILHKIHGSFQINSSSRERYLLELKDNPENKEIINDILRTNTSTNERLESYPHLYKELFEITGKPKSILDLGCGLNPISTVFMNLKDVRYLAYDINDKDSLFLNEFFKIEKINGISKTINLQSIENIKKLEKVDICFMFKLVDVLEKKGHKYSEEIIKVLIEKCKFIIVSFATASLGGRRMKFAERGWIERMLDRIGLKFEKIEFSNEIFYIISKN